MKRKTETHKHIGAVRFGKDFKKIALTAAVFVLMGGLIMSGCSQNGEDITHTSDTFDSAGGTLAESDKTQTPNRETKKKIAVDFSVPDNSKTSYLKKFDMFAATWGFCNDFSASPSLDSGNLMLIPSIGKLLPTSMRTDLFMGHYGIGRFIGAGSTLNGTTDDEYRLVSDVARSLNGNKIKPYFIYFASPIYTGGGVTNDKWKSVNDLDKWKELCTNMAAYFKNNGLNVMTHEIWNEPDYYITDPQKDGVFFLGTWQDYIDLYIAGAEGVRSSDEDALIGGVSAAWIHNLYENGDYAEFLNQVKASGAPLDYVSWHFYGSNGGMEMLEKYIAAARAGLEADSGFSTVQQHLNEFNVYLDTSVTTDYTMVRRVLSAYNQLLAATDVTRVMWTSAFDRDLGDTFAIINPTTDERYAAYYTMWMYARLPYTPVKVENSAKGVEVMASVSDTRAALIAYDSELTESEVTFDLSGLAADAGIYDMTVYVLDENNTSQNYYSDTPYILESFENVDVSQLLYTATVPEKGCVYIEINLRGSEKDAHEKLSGLYGHVARVDYWYPQRTDNGAYADIHLKSMTAVIGSGSAGDELGAACAATLDGMTATALKFNARIYGAPQKRSDSSMFGVTVCYHTESGYEKTLYCYFDGIDGSVHVPLGTGRKYDETIELDTDDGKYEIPLASYAPDGWDGRIMLGVIVNDVGRECSAVFEFGN